MRSVFSRGRRVVAACLLVVVLLAPSAFASDPADNASLWAEFVIWLEGRIDIPGGFAAADEYAFTLWLMSRLGVPNG